jgi:hypothetical protein
MREDAGRKCWMIIMGIPQKEGSSDFLHCFYDRSALVSAEYFHRICDGRFSITSIISYQLPSESRLQQNKKTAPKTGTVQKGGNLY